MTTLRIIRYVIDATIDTSKPSALAKIFIIFIFGFSRPRFLTFLALYKSD